MSERLPITTVAELLGTHPKAVYKHIERKRYAKDDKSSSVDVESFKDYIGKTLDYHQAMFEKYYNVYQKLT